MLKKNYLAPAKVNLFLEVIKKRADGYHDIETLFERIDLADKIELREIRGEDRLVTNSKNIPAGKDNLAFKALSLVKELAPTKTGIEIRLEKNIPVGAGLGGGSSDAATVLIGLNDLWGLGLSKKDLIGWARKIGADCAFFILEESFALGKGRGDELTPIDTQLKLNHVLVNPNVTVSTRDSYNSIKLSLTKHSLADKLFDYLDMLNSNSNTLTLFNRFEQHLSEKIPELAEIKRLLIKLGCKQVILSGSGPTMVGLIENQEKATLVVDHLRSTTSWWTSTTRTL